MAKGEHRVTLGLKCSVCKNVNYVTERNKINTEAKLVFKKYCKHCKKSHRAQRSRKAKIGYNCFA